MLKNCASVLLMLLCLCPSGLAAKQPVKDTSYGDKMVREYFRTETAKLRDKCLTNIKTLKDWKIKREVYRRQLFEMLGLEPLPEKTDLKPVITGKLKHDEFVVEKIHFQSRPGLYVTANLYIPAGLDKPAPTILYVCGHTDIKKNGIDYGNKAHYQFHPAWFARHGYVCLIIDTLQRGEIKGIHHGTYRYGMWWWNSRGYTSAGVEAWNCIRALDYLETRKEVDKDRIGVTGRSGGGAYSWWLAALDDRIKAAVPVAGITDLQNHVVEGIPKSRYPDGCAEGHCDCMYLVNTYRWDYPLVAALVAPRPLLISNSDKDDLFPLDGVVRLHEKVRHIYRLYNAEKNLGLNITEGPHNDTQEMRLHAFVWFNRFLKGQNPLIDKPAVSFFQPEQLKVFDELPVDEINTQIQESFTVKASLAQVPQSTEAWARQRDAWRKTLREKTFRGWPKKAEAGPLDVTQVFSVEQQGVRFSAFDFTSQSSIRLRLYLMHRTGLDRPGKVTLNVLDEEGLNEWLAAMRVGFAEQLKDYALPEPVEDKFNLIRNLSYHTNAATAYVAPRGIGPTAWNSSRRNRTHIRRRFMLLGQTLDGMRVWDVRRAVQAVRSIQSLNNAQIVLQAKRQMAGVALYAALFEPDIAELHLWDMPNSHRNGPTLLNVLRYLDLPQAVALAAERSRMTIYDKDEAGWQFPLEVAEKLGWPQKQLQVLPAPNGANP